MMRQMRENTKIIMLVTALAFVALMVFEWGMDITGQTAGLTELGRVNGQSVPYDRYQLTYRNLYDQVQAGQEEPVTSQQNREIEDAAWDEVVNQILIEQELGRRGITVTDEEVRQAALYSPPNEFRSNPAFLTDGEFDLQRYQDFIANDADNTLLLQLEAYYRDVLPRGKLLRQVSSGIYFPDAALWDRYRSANERVVVRYLPLNPAQRIDDASVEVSESEVQAYYRENQDEFAIPARATVSFAVLPKIPTPADTAAALQRAQDVRQEIADGADFAEVAMRESSDEGTRESGGDLGVFGRGAMVAPFEEAAFEARVGRITEPVQTTFGFHIIEVTQKWADSVQARHILIPVERTDESEIALLTRADSLEVLGESLPLTEAAAALGLEVDQADLTTDFPFITGAGRVSEGVDWALEEASPGDVSPVFETSEAFYALELISSQEAGFLSLADATGAIEQTLRMEKKLEIARNEGYEILGRLRGGEAMDDIAVETDLEIRTTDPFSRNDFVPGLGRQNAAIGAPFGINQGEFSDVVTTPTNAFILQVMDYQAPDSAAWEAQKNIQRRQLVAIEGQNRLGEWLQGLRDAATILDNREAVFRAAEEAPVNTGMPLGF
jgi:peptidyl-prolyl cis-trans isomerase D